MYSLYTASQVRELDRIAINELLIPGIKLMKRAGAATFETLRKYWPHARRITIVCGNGNNAGDGYVVARLASKAKLAVRVIQVGDITRLQGDALTTYQSMLKAGISPLPFTKGCLNNADIIIDAILGTGLTGEVRPAFRAAITEINDSDRPILAIDIPSGLNADTGQPWGIAVRANLTITFIGLKLGLFTGAGPEYSGQVVFHNLAVPVDSLLVTPTAHSLDLNALGRRWLAPRQRTAHKGHFGHVLVIGGAPGYAGAGCLAAEAAARVGAGLISLATSPAHAAHIVALRPEIMVHAVQNPDDLVQLLERATVLVVGPGLSNGSWALPLLRAAMSSGLPMVLDADALNLLAARSQELPTIRADWICTPHPGEAGRLLGCTAAEVQVNRLAAWTALTQRYGGIWVLKGAGTLVGDVGAIPGMCLAANPGMASGGMGDVLAGLLGGLLAQRIPALEAARLGVCLHAAAACHCARDGERGMLARDLMPYLRHQVNVDYRSRTGRYGNKRLDQVW